MEVKKEVNYTATMNAAEHRWLVENLKDPIKLVEGEELEVDKEIRMNFFRNLSHAGSNIHRPDRKAA